METNHFFIILFLILCSTIIFVVSIVYDYKSNKKFESSNEQYLIKRMTKIHRNYIVGFLLFGVISLITSLYGGDSKSNIFTYISFASTITSFVLSILAIFVTMQSNSGLEKQLMKIDNATNIITKLSEELDTTLSQVNKVTGEIGLSTGRLIEVSQNILPQVKETLNSSLSHHEDFIKQSLSNHETTMPRFSQEHNNKDKLDKLKEDFLVRMSAMGLAAIYACILSCEKNRSFKNDELFQSDSEYIYGILIATTSVNLVSINIKDGNETSCSSSEFTNEQI